MVIKEFKSNFPSINEFADSDSDIEAGISAGVKTLIKIGPKIKNYNSVHYFSDLPEVLNGINDLIR